MRAETVFFQKNSFNGIDYPVKDSIADFGMYCKEVPFVMCTEAKELSVVNFKDEDGDDEYIPRVLAMKAYEMEVTFAFKGKRDEANKALRAFLQYLTGQDGTGAEFSMYSTYTEIGRRSVRFVSIDPQVELFRDQDNDIIFPKIKFKVNDPVTDITLMAPYPDTQNIVYLL